MKKVFLSLAVIASVSLFSCGGNSEAKEEAKDCEATEAAAPEAEAAPEVEAAQVTEGEEVATPEGEAAAAEQATEVAEAPAN